MLKAKNIYRYIGLPFLMVLLGIFVACTEEMENIPTPIKKQSLPMARVAIADDANIETVRVLIFDENGGLVTNTGMITIDETNNGYTTEVSGNILTISSEELIASVGTNYVYVILNEGTWNLTDEGNLTDNLNGIRDKDAMEALRSKPIEYTEILTVEDGEKEPAFLMCVYDEVEVTSETQAIDLTGNAANGYSMSRSMAKVVLEQIIGGVRPNGTLVSTQNWNREPTVDQEPNDTDNEPLIGTSKIFIHKVELINVPKAYYWKEEQDQTIDYDKGYQNINLTNQLEKNPNSPYFLQRTWPGKIHANGTVGFTREDFVQSLWLKEASSGTNSYGYEAVYFDITKGGNQSFYKNNKDTQVTLNYGNFVSFLQGAYNQGNMNVEPGDIIPSAVEITESIIDPAPWTIDANVGYYIPENMTNTPTMLRIYYKIADITATIESNVITEAIKQAIANKNFDIVKNDGTIIDFTNNTDAALAYFYSLGYWISKEGYRQNYVNGDRPEEGGNDWKDADGNLYSTGTGTGEVRYAAYAWHGMSVIIGASGIPVSGTNNGYYYASYTNGETIQYIDIPLTNDKEPNEYANNDSWQDDTDEDHNIHRGREYRVKLYVTKSNPKWDEPVTPASRTINIGGEELTITGKVVATPMN